jgi:hypothetical protein
MKYIALLFLFATIGCDSSNEATSTNTLQGYVQLKDTVGNPLKEHSGVRISILGGTQTTTTTVDGQFFLPGFPVDRPFTLVFTKAGFAEEWYENYIAPKTEAGNVSFGLKRMYAIQTLHPSLVIRSFEDIFQGTQSQPSYKSIFSVRNLEFDTQKATSYCVIYFSKRTSIDAATPSSYEYGTVMQTTSNQDGTSYFDIYADSLYARGFKKGDKVYCQGYAAGYHCGESFHTDIATSKKIYTGLSPVHSGVKSFILP